MRDVAPGSVFNRFDVGDDPSSAVSSFEIDAELRLEAMKELYIHLRTTGGVSRSKVVQVGTLAWCEDQLNESAFGQDIWMIRCVNTYCEDVFKDCCYGCDVQ